jgi:hypothetical protein
LMSFKWTKINLGKYIIEINFGHLKENASEQNNNSLHIFLKKSSLKNVKINLVLF